jgi:hypothetical protein
LSINGTDDGAFGDTLDISVDGAPHTSIDTSCSEPIGPGLVRGDFEVIDGLSTEGGSLCPLPRCESNDVTNTASCYEDRNSRELRRLLFGTVTKPFSPPVVCGVVIDSSDAAREVLRSSACRGVRREALALILSIHRSILFGDGLLGGDGAVCFGVSPFEIELRCGGVFVPDSDTPDPDDALVVTGRTPISILVDGASRLCELAGCPGSGDPCAGIASQLSSILQDINESRSAEETCRLCPMETTPPVITCPDGVLAIECEGPDGARLDYQVTATDNCDPEPTITCTPPPGTFLPIGIRQRIDCTAEDVRGNSSSCSFEVEVVDTTPPVMSCPPGPILVDCAGQEDGVVVNYPLPTVSDTCDPNPIVTCDPPSGQLFPRGETMVTCTATDNAGNTAQCSFLVIVRDTTPPSIRCPDSFERECVQGGVALVEYPPPSVSDDCDPAPMVACDPPSGSLLPRGAHVITCRATDRDGNTASCQFTVTVVDQTSPVLVCPPGMTVECESPEGAIVDYPPPVANDACDGQPPVACTPGPRSLFPPGPTEVSCTSTDASGNTIQCSFVVTVVDTTPPAIACPLPMMVECAAPGGTRVDFTVTATDRCDPAPQVTCSPPSGSLFTLGQTTVDCTARDASGNQARCTFTVTVIDRTPPVLTCPQDMTVSCTTDGQPPHKPPGWPPGNDPPPNPCVAVADYPVPAASDACQGAAPQVTCTPPPGTELEIGTHTVTCRARDAAGNEAMCSFTIEVIRGENAFIRGDSNGDSSINIADCVFVLNHLFLGGLEPPCEDAADANDDGQMMMDDAVFIINYQFRAGRAPPSPFMPLCGLDSTADDKNCGRYLPCE